MAKFPVYVLMLQPLQIFTTPFSHVGPCHFIQSTIIPLNHTNFLLLKYIQGGDTFRLYKAIIRPYLKNRSTSFFSTFGIPSVYIDGVVIAYDMLFFYVEVKN